MISPGHRGTQQAQKMYQSNQALVTDKLLSEHAVLVKRIAYHLMAKMPDSVLVDDLIQAGMIGLIEASRHFDASKGASFETYAGIRIRGSMLDEVRRGDWVPRSVHRNARRIAEAIRQVEAETGQDAQDAQVALKLGVDIQQYNTLLQDTQCSRLFSFEDVLVDGEGQAESMIEGDEINPFDGLSDAKMQQSIKQALAGLPEREQLVMSLYYNDELNLKEIGEVLGVSESRVSQIHSQATIRLRSRLQQWLDDA